MLYSAKACGRAAGNLHKSFQKCAMFLCKTEKRRKLLDFYPFLWYNKYRKNKERR